MIVLKKMQRCSKFQSQGKILYKPIFCGIFTILLVFSISSQVYGEPNEQIDISQYYDTEGANFGANFGKVIQTDKLIFEIGRDTTVHVKHVIIGDAWGSDEPKLIKTLPGKHSNLEVTDEDGDYLRPMGFTGETFEESEYIIAGQKAFKNYDLIAEYDLENFLELSNDGMWSKHFKFPHNVEIYVDDGIELIFANARPINVSNNAGVNCIGCDIKIEFFDKPETITKKIVRSETKLEEISNTGEEFLLEFLSDGKINELNYIKELNYFSFNVNQKNQIFVIKIPLELLLSPYHVYLTEDDQEILVESDQIHKSEYGQTDTHANLSFKAPKEGFIHIVGSTEMEHQKLITKLQKRTDQAVSTENEDKSIFDIVKDQAGNEIKDEADDDVNELYENWEETSSNVDRNEDNTIIFIIVGVIAVIIIGIIIKLKKN